MPNPNLTEILCIIDRSGSMSSMAAEVIGGFNHFLEEQQKLPGEARLTLVQFDDRYEVPVDAQPIAAVPPLTDKTYVPRGFTALLDAVGRTFAAAGERLAKMDEATRPGKVVACIITDGQENASTEYNLEQIRAMLKLQQETYSWTVLFIGAGPEAYKGGAAMGVATRGLAQSENTKAGTRSSYAAFSHAVGSVRGTGGLAEDLSSYVSQGEKDVKAGRA